MDSSTIVALLKSIRDLIDLAKTLKETDAEESDDSEESKLDPWQAMLFQQSGPSRTFPRTSARRVNLANDSRTTKLIKLGKIPGLDENGF